MTKASNQLSDSECFRFWFGFRIYSISLLFLSLHFFFSVFRLWITEVCRRLYVAYHNTLGFATRCDETVEVKKKNTNEEKRKEKNWRIKRKEKVKERICWAKKLPCYLMYCWLDTFYMGIKSEYFFSVTSAAYYFLTLRTLLDILLLLFRLVRCFKSFLNNNKQLIWKACKQKRKMKNKL